MKKNIFILLVLIFSFASVSFTQAFTYNPTNKKLLNPVFSMFTRVEGRSSEVAGNSLLSTTGIEYMLGAPSWAGRFYFYGQGRFSYIAVGQGAMALRRASTLITYSPSSVGGIVGFGGYLFDKRDIEGKGFSLTMNGGIGMDFNIISFINDDTEGNPLGYLFSALITSPAAFAAMYTIPIELNSYLRYALNSKFALQVGINFGVDIAGHYIEDSDSIDTYPAFRYGLSVGLAF